MESWFSTLDVVSRTGIGKKTMKMPRAETEIYTIARRWIECGWQKGQSEVVDELHAPSFVDHNPAGRGSDNHGFKEGIVQLYAAFPDFYARIEDILIDGAQAKQRCDGLRQGRIAAHSWAVTRPAESSGLSALKLSGSIMAGSLNAGADGIQSNSWSNSSQKSVALSAALIQKEAVAWVRANRSPRLPATQTCAGFWLTVRARLSRRAGVKPRPTFFLQKTRSSERTKFLRYAG
jgi:predicted ester cyclase